MIELFQYCSISLPPPPPPSPLRVLAFYYTADISIRRSYVVLSLLSVIVSIRHCYQDLNDEQEEIIHEIISRQIQLYIKYRKVATDDEVSALIKHIEKTYNLALESVGVGSLEMKFRCPTLESLEHLWSDYQSGYLNEIAERYLVTDDIKKKLNLENVRLKTTIEDENYWNCRKILTENSCKFESLLTV